MGEVIELPLDGGRRALLLEEANGIRWYSCVLVDGASRTTLGAENRDYLLSHLRRVLEPSTQVDGTIDGRPVRWVLSLAEQHASLYVTADERDPTLVIQTAAGTTLEQAAISATDRLVWLSRMRS